MLKLSITKYFRGLYRLCECGCGILIPCINKRYEFSRFVLGHNIIGKQDKDHPMYKHGRYKERYKHVRINGKQIRTHIHVFQQYHQCCMLPWGDIHHINENKLDNRIENLQGMMHGKHSSIHMIDNKYASKSYQNGVKYS